MHLLYKLFLIVIVVFAGAMMVYLIRRGNRSGRSMESHIKRQQVAMESTGCDYTLDLSKSNKVLWKACHNGYDRYYLPEKVWFKNKKPNQSATDKSMCIGKAIQEIRRTHPEFSSEVNENSEYDLWLSEECKS